MRIRWLTLACALTLSSCISAAQPERKTTFTSCLDRIPEDNDETLRKVDTLIAASKTHNARLGFGADRTEDATTHTRPRVLQSVPPAFPHCAIERGLEGRCQVYFNVDDSGTATDINALCTNKVFVSAATRSVRRTKYEPAAISGQPVRFEGLVRPITFILADYETPSDD